MKLNHLNLTVTDVVATRKFLEKYFGMRGMSSEYNTGFDVLFDDDDLVLTMFRAAKGTEALYPATFHIGFIQESEERVDELHQRLKEDGYEVPAPARLHGAWTFYFQSPGGFTIEVLC